MKRACKWLAGIVAVPVVGFGLLVAAALWTNHQRQANFSKLPAGERQLAIFDAFAGLVESTYYDRRYVERDWPALRDRWRAEAARTRTDFDVYFKVLMQLTLNFPTSHLAASPPPPRTAQGASDHTGNSPQAPPGRTGLTVTFVRRGKGKMGLVDSVASGSPAALAGVEPGWQLISYNSCRVGEQATSRFFAFGTPEERIRVESTGNIVLHDRTTASTGNRSPTG